MSGITGGELFARALQAEGIEFLFGLPSPEIDPLLVQLEAHGIRLVPIRHEAAGVHMAEGLYKTTGKVSAVLGKRKELNSDTVIKWKSAQPGVRPSARLRTCQRRSPAERRRSRANAAGSGSNETISPR